MMYVISDDLGKYDGDNYIRKLDEVVTHEKYEHLPLMRATTLMPKSETSCASVLVNIERPALALQYAVYPDQGAMLYRQGKEAFSVPYLP